MSKTYPALRVRIVCRKHNGRCIDVVIDKAMTDLWSATGRDPEEFIRSELSLARLALEQDEFCGCKRSDSDDGFEFIRYDVDEPEPGEERAA